MLLLRHGTRKLKVAQSTVELKASGRTCRPEGVLLWAAMAACWTCQDTAAVAAARLRAAVSGDSWGACKHFEASQQPEGLSAAMLEHPPVLSAQSGHSDHSCPLQHTAQHAGRD